MRIRCPSLVKSLYIFGTLGIWKIPRLLMVTICWSYRRSSGTVDGDPPLLPESRSKCKFSKPNAHIWVILELSCSAVLPVVISPTQDLSLINKSLKGNGLTPSGGGRNVRLRPAFNHVPLYTAAIQPSSPPPPHHGMFLLIEHEPLVSG